MNRIIIAVLLISLSDQAVFGLADSNFLVISDIHFNPLADQTLNHRLAAADSGDWEMILGSGKSAAFSSYGQDTNWPLLHSVLKHFSALPKKPQFVLVTGDLLAHHLSEQFRTGDSSASDFGAFVQKSIAFLAREFKAALPGVPVITALGNNDGDCRDGDYTTQPGGAFLRNTLPGIANAMNVPPQDIEDSWTSFGSYDIPHPTLRNRRIIVLNSTFLSARYQNACGKPDEDPGSSMLEWLRRRLAGAKARNQKAWLVYHIPPGVDGYASTHPKGSNAESIVTMWNSRYQQAFEAILAEHADAVQNQFAGHTHFDDFRLLGKPGAYSSFVLLNPALSPNVRQNPAFREFRSGPDGTLSDARTWYLPKLDGMGENVPGEWKLEYSYRRQWKSKTLDLATLTMLYSRIRAVPEIRERWETNYSVTNMESARMTEQAFAATSCATGNGHVEDFRKCFCSTVPSAAFCMPIISQWPQR